MAERAARRGATRQNPEAQPASDVGFRPLYIQVKDSITRSLIAGEWRPGDKLPNEFELAARYGVSQGTARKALDELTAQNILVREQGRGTFVATHNPENVFFYFFHLVGPNGSRQMSTSRVLSVVTDQATREEEGRLDLRRNNRVIRIDRIRELSGHPSIVERIVVSAKRFGGLAKMAPDQVPNIFYTYYEKVHGVTVFQAEERLRAVVADPREAELLGVSPGHPLLEIDRIALGIDRKPVEWRLSHCLTTDHYYLSIID